MKKYTITSLLLFVPFMSMASDHCTNPKEYTIDRRCYVTDEQKKQKPYNAVVGVQNLKRKGDTVCTGTIAKWDHDLTRKDSPDWNSLLYLFTAKHCTDQDGDGLPDKSLHIKLQNGDKFDVTLVGTGDYDINKDSNQNGDWAIYSLPVDLIKDATGQYHVNMISAEKMKDKTPWIYADSDGVRNDSTIRLIGYGSLKIMSDKEIKKFKQKYIDFLKKHQITNISYENTSILDDGSIDMSRTMPKLFKMGLSSGMLSSLYISDLFDDIKLKFSLCSFGGRRKCQGWGGNSGGPMIDNLNRLVSVVTRGNYYIGGANHASVGGVLYNEHEQIYEIGDIPTERIYKIMEGLIRIEKTWDTKFEN